MNLSQVLQQIQFLAQEVTWPDPPSDKVFGALGDSVQITNGFDPEMLKTEIRYPAAFISDAGGVPHREDSRRKEPQRIAFVIVVDHLSDPWGSGASVGANRVVTVGSSAFRGIFEVYEPVIDQILDRGRESGLTFIVAGESEAAPINVDGSKSMLAKSWTFHVRMYDLRTFDAPLRFAGVAASPTVTLSWIAPPLRFDNPTASVSIVRKTGSPPTSITDGTLVADGITGTGFVDTPGAGTFFYGLAAKYDAGGTAFTFSPLLTAGGFTV